MLSLAVVSRPFVHAVDALDALACGATCLGPLGVIDKAQTRTKVHCGKQGGYLLGNQHSNGISPFLIRNASSKDPFSIAMLIYRSVPEQRQQN